MENAAFHFEDVHSVAHSEDGKYLIMQVTGAAGICGTSIPTDQVPRILAMLMSVAGQAAKLGAEPAIKHIDVSHFKMLKHKTSNTRILSVYFSKSSPPLHLRLEKKALVDFSLAFLQTEGLLPSDKPGTRQ